MSEAADLATPARAPSPVIERPCLTEYRRVRISDDRLYRYRLDVCRWERAMTGTGTLLAIVERPNNRAFRTDAENDATEDWEALNRLRIRAARGGFPRLVVCSLFARRDPLILDSGVVGPENDAEILAAAREADMILACWGPVSGRQHHRADEVEQLLRPFDVHVLGRAHVSGEPWPIAPDAVSPDAAPILWRRVGE